MSQRGAVNLPTLVAVVLGLGFGASAYLNYSQYSHTLQDKKLLNGEITDLKYQVQQDHLGTTPTPSSSASPSDSPSPSPSASTTPTPSQSPAVAGASSGTLNTDSKMHTDANTSSGLVFPSLLPKGTVVTVNGDAPNGYKSVTYNGKTGFIKASFIQ